MAGVDREDEEMIAQKTTPHRGCIFGATLYFEYRQVEQLRQKNGVLCIQGVSVGNGIVASTSSRLDFPVVFALGGVATSLSSNVS